MEVLYAAVQPLVWTREAYSRLYDEDDPEEIALLQSNDLDRARAIGEVLRDLFMVDEYDPAEPRFEFGPEDEIGTIAAFRVLRDLAAGAAGYTVDDYHEGRVPAGDPFQHLINHSEDEGFYLPVDFVQPFWVDEVSVGSAVGLLRDLEGLRPILAAHHPVELAQAEAGAELDTLTGGPVWVWWGLARMCRAALDMRLPVALG